MDKERIKGAAETVSGSIKKALGRLIGSKSLVTEGKIDSATGAIRTAVGEGKDTVKDIQKSNNT